jgi:hypothetical protein
MKNIKKLIVDLFESGFGGGLLVLLFILAMMIWG